MKIRSARLLETSMMTGFVLSLVFLSWNSNEGIALLLPFGITFEIGWFLTSISPREARRALGMVVPVLLVALFSSWLLQLTQLNAIWILPLSVWGGWLQYALFGIGEIVALGLLGVVLLDLKGPLWFQDSIIRSISAWAAGSVIIVSVFLPWLGIESGAGILIADPNSAYLYIPQLIALGGALSIVSRFGGLIVIIGVWRYLITPVIFSCPAGGCPIQWSIQGVGLWLALAGITLSMKGKPLNLPLRSLLTKEAQEKVTGESHPT